jgi:hypothetical protein
VYLSLDPTESSSGWYVFRASNAPLRSRRYQTSHMFYLRASLLVEVYIKER